MKFISKLCLKIFINLLMFLTVIFLGGITSKENPITNNSRYSSRQESNFTALLCTFRYGYGCWMVKNLDVFWLISFCTIIYLKKVWIFWMS